MQTPAINKRVATTVVGSRLLECCSNRISWIDLRNSESAWPVDKRRLRFL